MSGQGKAPRTCRHRARARVLPRLGGEPVVSKAERAAGYAVVAAAQLADRHDDIYWPNVLRVVAGLALGAGVMLIAWGMS